MCTASESSVLEIGDTTHRILTEWLPSSGYEWAQKADVEVYFGPNTTAKDYRSQILLPIERCSSWQKTVIFGILIPKFDHSVMAWDNEPAVKGALPHVHPT